MEDTALMAPTLRDTHAAKNVTSVQTYLPSLINIFKTGALLPVGVYF